MKTGVKVVLVLVVATVVGANAWYWLRPSGSTPGPVIAQPEPLPEAPAPLTPASAPPVGIQYPVEDIAAPEQPTAAADLASATADLFGNKAVSAMFQVDGLAHRIVATADALGRDHASPRLWPVNPTAGKFLVDIQGNTATVSADNDLRYTPYVLLLETVDLRQVVAVYARFYPQIQQAYEDLGFPGRYFNDRLVAVIDQMLVTPDISTPLPVHLPTANSPVQASRPWLLYEFDDPALQSLTAGQRILLRTGPVNERRIKAKLRELRRLLTASTARPPR
jgi:hypothetical protein